MFLFKKNVRVVVKNLNLALELKTGSNLYQALVAENVVPPTLCKGNGQCGKCKVHITQRSLPKPNKREKLVLAPINLDAGFRLACQTTIKEDMVIDTSEITAAHSKDEFVVRPVKPPVAQVEAPEEERPEEPVDYREVAEPVDAQADLPRAPFYCDTDDTAEDTGGAQAVEYEVPLNPDAHSEDQPVLTTPQKYASPPLTRDKLSDNAVAEHEPVDGLLLVQNKGQMRYFLYSAAIDTVAQEGTVENVDIAGYIRNGNLTDFVHEELKVKDIDRLIVMSDEPSTDGEHIFDMVSYTPFDIGALPCELIRPLHDSGDFSLFLRLLSQKGKHRLMISLDKLDHCYYIAESRIVRLPNNTGSMHPNLFDTTSLGNNPIIDISDDFKTIKCAKEFLAPDSLPLPMLMRTAGLMVKNKLADSELRIFPRSRLEGVPLDYIVKVTQHENGNAFYLYRNKEASLLVTQPMLSALVQARNYVHFAVDYTEANLGNIETIIICTPNTLPSLLDNMAMIGMVPPRHQNITIHNPGDSSVMAVKLFQETDVRTYIHKHYGTFITSE